MSAKTNNDSDLTAEPAAGASQALSGTVTFEGTAPARFSQLEGQPRHVEITAEGIYDQSGLREPESAMALTIQSLYRYSAASRDLLRTKYKQFVALAPRHLVRSSAVLVVRCADAIIVRYEVNDALEPEIENKVLTRYMGSDQEGPASELLPVVSQSVAYAEAPRSDEDALTRGVELSVQKSRHDGADVLILSKTRLHFTVGMAVAPGKGSMRRLCSVSNVLEVEIHGYLCGSEGHSREQPMLIKAPVALPVGWATIDVYHGADPLQWSETEAYLLADRDITAHLAAVGQKELALKALDPSADLRQNLIRVFDEFANLLVAATREEDLQQFLYQYPQILRPANVRMWPKLKFGRHVSDFVFRDATGGYLLVEIERANMRLFNKPRKADHCGEQSADLTHAIGQIQDWVRYIEDNAEYVRREMQLTDISTRPETLIVAGRRADLGKAEKRKLQVIENSSPGLKIWTYDDVLDNARAAAENLLGPMEPSQGKTRIFYPTRDHAAVPKTG